MTHATFSAPANNAAVSSVPQIRVWVQAIHDALTAIGMIQTADTGQLTISTIPAPSSGNTVSGYEVWRFDDDMQATAPIFVKIEYGASSSGANVPATWVTVGTGSDGAGNLTGVFYARTALLATANTVGGVTNAGLASSGDGAMCAVVWPLVSSAADAVFNSMAGVFIIERSRDQNGAPTAEGCAIIVGSAASTNTPFTAHRFSTESDTVGLVPVQLPTTVAGVALGSVPLAVAGVIPAQAWDVYFPGLTARLFTALVSIPPADVPAGEFVVPMPEGDVHYLPVVVGPTSYTVGGRYGSNAIRTLGVRV